METLNCKLEARASSGPRHFAALRSCVERLSYASGARRQSEASAI